MGRRGVGLITLLLMSLLIGACSTVRMPDTLTMQAGETFAQIKSYRVRGEITKSGGRVQYLAEFGTDDRVRLLVADSESKALIEVVAANGLFYMTDESPELDSDQRRWQLLSATDGQGRLVAKLIDQARLKNLARLTAERVGDGLVEDYPCALYRTNLSDGHMLTWVTPTAGVVLKTQILRMEELSTYEYGSFNRPIRIDLPIKGLLR